MKCWTLLREVSDYCHVLVHRCLCLLSLSQDSSVNAGIIEDNQHVTYVFGENVSRFLYSNHHQSYINAHADRCTLSSLRHCCWSCCFSYVFSNSSIATMCQHNRSSSLISFTNDVIGWLLVHRPRGISLDERSASNVDFNCWNWQYSGVACLFVLISIR